MFSLLKDYYLAGTVLFMHSAQPLHFIELKIMPISGLSFIVALTVIQQIFTKHLKYDSLLG